jgi:site-specific DNA-methyltransferase (cytosine-N4-specific)
MLVGETARFLSSEEGIKYKGKVQLVFTSPPFPLNRKKRYGNIQGEAYIAWLAAFGPPLRDLLTPDGSIVMEIGNAWEPGNPTMSTLALKSLLGFVEQGGLHLCQQFICHNPAKLPSPAQWVNVERIRVTDAFTHVWWMSTTPRPKADNRRVLREYSASMRQLLQTGSYNAGRRPSEHNIGETSFLRDNGGAIPSNVLSFSNTAATDDYQRYCVENNLPKHPARMPSGLADFFIKFLTDAEELVFDPFAGSNTTGASAERLGRRWLSLEMNPQYAAGSIGRFPSLAATGNSD